MLHCLYLICVRSPSLRCQTLRFFANCDLGFSYGCDSLLGVCSWATSIGHSCLDDFQKDVRLDSLAGAGAVAPNVLRYIEDVLKAYSCVSWFVRGSLSVGHRYTMLMWVIPSARLLLAR